jgi:hypothetical protein
MNTIGLLYNLSLLVLEFNRLKYWLSTFIPIPLVHRVGCRPLMLFSAVGQTISKAAYPGDNAAYRSHCLSLVRSFPFLLC